RIQGRFPHARYISYNVYDPAQRPLDALADSELRPDPGSSNPFLPGADRTVANRSYTAFVDFGPIPPQKAPNTLYSGTGQNGAPALAANVTDNEGTDPIYQGQQGLDLPERGGNGGFLSNLHNAYVSAVISRGYGQVTVTRMRPPTFPDTRGGAPRMPSGQQ